jgi:hypothetical protein
MGNMGYCRFENTYHDLDDCYTSLHEKSFDELSETEKKFALKLVRMCRDISEEFMDDVEEIEGVS